MVEKKKVEEEKIEVPKEESPKEDKKKAPEPKKVLERVYIVPLRRKTVKTAMYTRTPKAVRVIKEFMIKHMKSKIIMISKDLNLKLWSRGIKNPPGKIKVKAIKYDNGKVVVSQES